MQTAKTLIRLGGCPGWSESSLGAQPFCHVAAQMLFKGFEHSIIIMQNFFKSFFGLNLEDSFICILLNHIHCFNSTFTSNRVYWLSACICHHQNQTNRVLLYEVQVKTTYWTFKESSYVWQSTFSGYKWLTTPYTFNKWWRTWRKIPHFNVTIPRSRRYYNISGVWIAHNYLSQLMRL